MSNLYAIAIGHQSPGVVTPVFPNATAECWSSSTYIFRPVFNGYGAALTYAWTLDSGSGPVTINGATGPSLAFQSIPGITVGGGPYTLAVSATSLYGSTNSSVTLALDAPPTVAQTIYSDSFARSGQLTGSEPDTADLYSTVWSADGSLSCNGSQALASSAYQFDAWLPFVPQVGHVYILSCDLNPLNSDANWLGLGFSTAQDSGLDTNVIATTVEARGNRGYVSGGTVLIPDVASNSSGTGVTPYDAAGVSTYQVELDTTTEPWTRHNLGRRNYAGITDTIRLRPEHSVGGYGELPDGGRDFRQSQIDRRRRSRTGRPGHYRKPAGAALCDAGLPGRGPGRRRGCNELPVAVQRQQPGGQWPHRWIAY